MLKVAILAEKYAVDYTWYVDIILNLIRIAGDFVSEEVWYRVIQIVINRDDVQGYAAKTVFEVRCLYGIVIRLKFWSNLYIWFSAWQQFDHLSKKSLCQLLFSCSFNPQKRGLLFEVYGVILVTANV